MDVKQDQKQMSPSVVNALTAVNKITYDMPAQIGITDRITHQEDQFSQASYTSGEMLLIAQTGSAFVDPYDSWLKLTIATATPVNQTQSFGVGSMANCFDEILVESRTGRDLSRLRSASLFIKNYQDWTHSPAWKATEGIAQGYPLKTDFKETGTAVAIGNNAGSVIVSNLCMRLSDLMPCFRPIGGRLLPPQFMEGLRLRIFLNSGVRLGPQTGAGTAGAITFTISNPRIQWKVVSLNDAFKRKIQEIASTRGLVVMYKEVHQQQAPSTTTAFDNEVNKAVSKALRAYVVPRLQTYVTPSADDQDPNTSQVFNWAQAQSRIGNDYFPQKALVSTAVTDYREFYTYCLHSMGYCENPQEAPVVQPNNGGASEIGCYGSADASNSKSIMIFSYNKSSVSDLDGYVINNSRSLIFNFNLLSATSTRYDTFLEYLRVAIVFNSNIDVKD